MRQVRAPIPMLSLIAVVLAALACDLGGTAVNDQAEPGPATAADEPFGESNGAPAGTVADWTRVAGSAELGGPEDQVMADVAAGGPGFVAVGWDVNLRSAAVWTSTDGTDWTRVPHDESIFGGSGDEFMAGVVAGGPGLVAVGSGTVGADYNAIVWTSEDGLNWSRVPHDPAVFAVDDWQQMLDVTVGGPGLVAVGYGDFADRDAAVWTSPDGLSWTRLPGDEAVFGGEGVQMMQAVAAAGPGLVAVGVDDDFMAGTEFAAVWTSQDGLSWTRVANDRAVFGEDDPDMRAVLAGGPGVVAAGYSNSGAAVWISTDGQAWTRVAHDDSIFGKNLGVQMLDLVVANGKLVASGENNEAGEGIDAAIWTSADGLAWTAKSSDAFTGTDRAIAYGIAFDGSRLVAVGSDGMVGDLDGAVWVGTVP